MYLQFPSLPKLRPLAYPNLSASHPSNHQYDIVFSFNYGSLPQDPEVLVRDISEEEWAEAVCPWAYDGTEMIVGYDQTELAIAKHVLRRTENSYRRITYVWRPWEITRSYHELHGEPIPEPPSTYLRTLRREPITVYPKLRWVSESIPVDARPISLSRNILRRETPAFYPASTSQSESIPIDATPVILNVNVNIVSDHISPSTRAPVAAVSSNHCWSHINLDN